MKSPTKPLIPPKSFTKLQLAIYNRGKVIGYGDGFDAGYKKGKSDAKTAQRLHLMKRLTLKRRKGFKWRWLLSYVGR